MSDPWADFRVKPATSGAAVDEWAEFRKPSEATASTPATTSPAPAPADAWGGKGEFLNGATFGFLDELGAGVFTPVELGLQVANGEPVSVSGAYSSALERQRSARDAYRKENPTEAMAAGVAGGLFTGGAVGPKILHSGASLVGNTIKGAVSGGVGGAASGFGEGDTLDERASGAATGLGVGLGLGAAVPGAARLVGKGVEAFGASRAARDTLAPVGIGRRAGDQIERELARDGLTPADAAVRANQMGPDAMLLDTGRNVAEGADAVANMPGAGNKMVRDRLAARTKAAPERIAAAANTAMGPARNIAETTEALIAKRTADSAPHYAAALGRPIEWNDRLQAFVDDPITRGGLRKGMEIQRLEALAKGEKFDPLDYAVSGFDEAGEPILVGTPNMRTLNVIKKGLDNTIEGYRDPTTGRLALDEYGRAVNDVQRAFISELDNVNPDYAAARAAWAGPTRVKDATGLGQDVFNRSVRPDQLRQRLAAMSDDEREAFQIGARDQLAEVMGTARRDATAARAMFETGWNREKLGLVLGDDERARQFLDTLGTETDFANRANSIAGNSASARRLERQKEYGGQRSMAREAVDPSSGLWGDTKRVLARGADALLDGRNARTAEQMRAEFGDAVTRQGDERSALVEAITAYGGKKTQAKANALSHEELMRAIFAGGALGVGGEFRR